MELTSYHFLLFILAVLILYYALSRVKGAQRYVIAAANVALICFMTRKTILILIVFLVLFVYFAGLLLDKAVKEKRKALSNLILYGALFFVVAYLCYFKFFKWTYELLQQTLALKGIGLVEWIFPIGLSYYTLTMCAYLLDISHKKHEAERNLIDFFAFVTFFPSLIEGPINLYRKLMPQIKEQHMINPDNLSEGFVRILWGYFKKLVIADRIGVLVIGILSDETAAGPLVFFAMVLYSFQIYADFSGGIDVVMGVARMMDIGLTENFKAPLLSVSVTEYWARWHMSLGEFMEKYIYYPIVLNRRIMKLSKKIKSTYYSKAFSAFLASVIVFVIVGIWHGTGWNYVVYGCYQAFFVGGAVLMGPVYKALLQKLHIQAKNPVWHIFVILRTFTVLTFGRYFIRAKDLTGAFELFARTFTSSAGKQTLLEKGLDVPGLIVMAIGILILIIADILAGNGIRIREKVLHMHILARFAFYMVTIVCIIVFGMYGGEFTGASFIYQGF
ncbi:MAG: MBOAT family protein [Lachnospiraceae bacterium]|nr:MBOAT family protein [Lachnospiraceae bacterium]